MEGSLDVYLLRPKDVWINVLCSRTIVSAWGDFVYGFIVLTLSAGTTPGSYLLFTALIIPGALVFTATFAAAESLALYIGNASSISNALAEFMLSFSLYPEGIYGPGLRWALYSIIPAGFVAFMPLRLYRAIGWAQVPLLYLIAVAYVLLSYTLFRAGLRRYESGNRMDSRV